MVYKINEGMIGVLSSFVPEGKMEYRLHYTRYSFQCATRDVIELYATRPPSGSLT